MLVGLALMATGLAMGIYSLYLWRDQDFANQEAARLKEEQEYHAKWQIQRD